MKTLTYLLIILILTSFSSELLAQQTYVPDDNFEQALINLGYDEGALDDYVPTANIDTVTILDLYFLEIANLTGIDAFINLEILDCSTNLLTNIDLSNNKALLAVDCSDNYLSNIDLINNVKLEELVCNWNLLTQLIIKQNTKLIYLFCRDNQITNINLTSNSNLVELICANNNFNTLDLSHNEKLKYLNCSVNNIEYLDLSNNSELETFDCSHNTFVSFKFTSNNNLKELVCFNNQFSIIQLSQFKNLVELSCSHNNLDKLNCTDNSKLKGIVCSYNNLNILDFSNNLELEFVNCRDNNLSKLNLRNGFNFKISSINARNNSQLICIQVDDPDWSSGNNYWFIDDHASFSEDCGFTGVESILLDTDISIFPNPSSNTINISFELKSPQAITMSLSDLSGNVVKEFELANALNINKEIDVSQLPSGVYFLNVSMGDEVVSKKVVVE